VFFDLAKDYRWVTDGLTSEAQNVSQSALLFFLFEKPAELKFGVPKAFPERQADWKSTPRKEGALTPR
ncbi:MAG TPA: hypothetical protein PLN20_04955, partial [Thermotogota bacterium]|nr:hypothetical protein [Thermotogota bacterium]